MTGFLCPDVHEKYERQYSLYERKYSYYSKLISKMKGRKSWLEEEVSALFF